MAIALLHESTFDTAVQLDDAVESKSARTNRRAEVRLSAEDASWLRGARLKYGAEVRVIDVSSGGILFEADGATPAPHSTVVFELSGPQGTVLAPARILRSHVTRKGTNPRYQAACEFKRPLSIDTLAAVAKERRTRPGLDSPRQSRSRLNAPPGSASWRAFATATSCADTPTIFIRRSRIST